MLFLGVAQLFAAFLVLAIQGLARLAHVVDGQVHRLGHAADLIGSPDLRSAGQVARGHRLGHLGDLLHRRADTPPEADGDHAERDAADHHQQDQLDHQRPGEHRGVRAAHLHRPGVGVGPAEHDVHRGPDRPGGAGPLPQGRQGLVGDRLGDRGIGDHLLALGVDDADLHATAQLFDDAAADGVQVRLEMEDDDVLAADVQRRRIRDHPPAGVLRHVGAGLPDLALAQRERGGEERRLRLIRRQVVVRGDLALGLAGQLLTVGGDEAGFVDQGRLDVVQRDQGVVDTRLGQAPGVGLLEPVAIGGVPRGDQQILAPGGELVGQFIGDQGGELLRIVLSSLVTLPLGLEGEQRCRGEHGAQSHRHGANHQCAPKTPSTGQGLHASHDRHEAGYRQVKPFA
ncbi:MAG: hypothetical protein U0Q19_05730 [Kineosporiaceae bacterium]